MRNQKLRSKSKRANAIKPIQREATQRVIEFGPSLSPDGVRKTAGGNPPGKQNPTLS